MIDLINQFSVAWFILVCNLFFKFFHLLIDLDLLEMNALLLTELVIVIVRRCILADFLIVESLLLISLPLFFLLLDLYRIRLPVFIQNVSNRR
jgi:hypothetical protein